MLPMEPLVETHKRFTYFKKSQQQKQVNACNIKLGYINGKIHTHVINVIYANIN